MTFPVIDDADAERLLIAMRDGAFGWTVDELPDLYRSMGWKLAAEVPNAGAVALAEWGFDDASVDVLYKDGAVATMTLNVTDLAEETPAGRLAVAEAFSRLVTIATGILGQPTKTFKGANPRVRWRNEKTSVMVQNVQHAVLVIWATAAFQDHADKIGRS